VHPKPRPKGYKNKKKKAHMASGATKTEAKRVSNLKEKKKPIWPRVQLKPRQKAGSMASGAVKTEAEGASMASILNRGQKLCSFGLAPICFGSRTGAEY